MNDTNGDRMTLMIGLEARDQDDVLSSTIVFTKAAFRFCIPFFQCTFKVITLG